jgi:hypothetical protein
LPAERGKTFKARAGRRARNPMARFAAEWELFVALMEVKLALFFNGKFMQPTQYAIPDCTDGTSKCCNHNIE